MFSSTFLAAYTRNPLLPQVILLEIHTNIEQILSSIFFHSERNASSPMKIDTLQFVHTVLVHHSPEVAHAHIAALLPSLLNAVSDPFYKITSEALLVLQQLVRFDRSVNMDSMN